MKYVIPQREEKQSQMNGAVSKSLTEDQSGIVNAKIEKAFLKAFDEFAPKLYRFCLLRVGSKELAEDLVSQTFLNAWEYVQSGKEIKSYSAFLYKTVRNLIIDHWRTHRPITISLDDVPEDAFVDSHYTPEGIDEALSKDIELKKVLNALNIFPYDQRNILYWRFVDDLSIKEIAELSGKKSGAIYVIIYRGIKKLKQLFYNND